MFIWKTDPIKQLGKLKAGLRNKAQRIAMNKAASPMKALVVSNTPSETGALKKSMRIKIKSYKNGTKWICVIGPKSDLVVKKKKFTKKPATYNQIVNKGSKFMKGRHHMDNSAKIAGKQFYNRYIQALREVIPPLLNN